MPEHGDIPSVDRRSEPLMADSLRENWDWKTDWVSAPRFRQQHYQIYPGHRPGLKWSLEEVLVLFKELDDQWHVSDCAQTNTSPKCREMADARFTLSRLPGGAEVEPGNV
jgi:hypothetical protein